MTIFSMFFFLSAFVCSQLVVYQKGSEVSMLMIEKGKAYVVNYDFANTQRLLDQVDAVIEKARTAENSKSREAPGGYEAHVEAAKRVTGIGGWQGPLQPPGP
jgi:hypothetical protein